MKTTALLLTIVTISSQVLAQRPGIKVKDVIEAAEQTLEKVNGKPESTPTTQPKSELQKRIDDLQLRTETAKNQLKEANRPQAERIKELDDSIAIIERVLGEVAEKGEIGVELDKAINTSLMKLEEYKAKMLDSKASARQQAAYQKLVSKFKDGNEGLLKTKNLLVAQREELTKALDQAKRDKTLYADMIQANEILEANEAVMEMVKTMSLVTDSLTKVGDEVEKQRDVLP
jgi:transposase-like protein